MADLLLIEHEQQLPCVVPPGAGIIALSAEAMNALDAAQLPYATLDGYLPTAQVTALGQATYAPVAAWCDRLDTWVRSIGPAIPFGPAAVSQYDFTILAQTILVRAAELRALLATEAPRRIYAWPTRPDRLDDTLAFQRESAYMRVLPLVAAERGIAIEWARQPSTPHPPIKTRRWVPRLVPTRWRPSLASYRRSWWPCVRTWRQTGAHRRDTLLVFQVSPEIARFMDEEATHWRFVVWPGQGWPLLEGWPRPRRSAASPSLRTPLPLELFLDLVPPPFEGLVLDRVLHFVRGVVPAMMAAAEDMRHVIDRYHPCVTLAGILATPRVRAAAALGRALGVPLALWQHGGAYGYLAHPGHYYHELRHADVFLGWGPGVTQGLAAFRAALPQ